MSHSAPTIEGTVAPGFESVKDLFAKNIQKLTERNNQLCVYYKGDKVVDLWSTKIDDQDFTPDSLVNVFSSGKSFEAIAMASLVDKELLNYDDPISQHWPEFYRQEDDAVGNKSHLTIAQLMRHEAGLASFNVSIDPKDLLPENIKQNRIGEVIEAHPLTYRTKGSEREYHAVTRGWIVNEVFRRVDPAGRTIGEFLQQDLSEPLEVDAFIGLSEAQLARRSEVVPVSIRHHLGQGFKPGFMGRPVEMNIFQSIGRLGRILPRIRHSTSRGKPPPYIGMKGIRFFNEPAVAMGETPSANTHASARGLARIAAMMSQRGRLASQTYLGEAGWQAMHAEPVKRDMGIMTTTFTQGGVAEFETRPLNSPNLERAFNNGRDGFYGWMGLGGSIFQWHPEHEIGFGYVPTSLNILDIFNERGKSYQAEVLACVKKLG